MKKELEKMVEVKKVMCSDNTQDILNQINATIASIASKVEDMQELSEKVKQGLLTSEEAVSYFIDALAMVIGTCGSTDRLLTLEAKQRKDRSELLKLQALIMNW